jgi:hypothetical protein
MANHQNGSIVHFKNILDILVIIAIIHILKNVRSIKYTLIVIYNGRLPLPLIFPILADKYYQTNGDGGGGGVMVLNITFNNILVGQLYWRRKPKYTEKLPQDTDKPAKWECKAKRTCRDKFIIASSYDILSNAIFN